jgi:hypothetical protein
MGNTRPLKLQQFNRTVCAVSGANSFTGLMAQSCCDHRKPHRVPVRLERAAKSAPLHFLDKIGDIQMKRTFRGTVGDLFLSAVFKICQILFHKSPYILYINYCSPGLPGKPGKINYHFH